MNSYTGPDRRCSEESHLALRFDVAVNYYRTVGVAKAMSFVHANGMPQMLAERVTGSPRTRRLTCWESHVDEQALRIALGARPLLPAHAESEAEQHRNAA